MLVAPSGVYIIETKTYSKPDKGESRIIYTGDTLIHHNGFKDDKPLIQVKAGANWLKQLIKESTGRDIDVKGVAKNSNFLVSARKHRAENWNVLEVHENSTGLAHQHGAAKSRRHEATTAIAEKAHF